ncbi:MAG: nucleotidyl transferase AbiEii/AbiGii toxin family protein [Coriobacteriia bacterium]
MARLQHVDPAVIDRDYALGIVLYALAATMTEGAWIFKGGTCLRKCYYADYRFSEDLDFTTLGVLRITEAEKLITRAAAKSAALGVELLLDRLRTEIMDDEYGKESLEIKVPYQGALRMGSAPNIQFHLSSNEEMVFAPKSRELIHPYDDAIDVPALLHSYTLEEILSEKLRAVCGQRRHPIARDVYDIAQLLGRNDVDVDAALDVLPRKAEIKGINVRGSWQRFVERRPQYQANWNQQLAYLVVGGVDFATAFDATADLLRRVDA